MRSLFLEILAATLFFFKPSFAIDQGLHLRLHGKKDHNASLLKRGIVVGVSSLTDSSDISYYSNITLGGSPFSVLIDTGSSDLWVAGNVQNSANTGHSASVTYAIGSVNGPVLTSTLDFAGYQVPNQAYIQATTDASHPVDIGLIGLGPNSGSNIFSALGGSSGDTVIDRIFKQNTSTPNFMTVLMGRYDDPTETFPGDLTVGDILSGYEAVSSQPQLSVTRVPLPDSGGQHWQTLLDADGILGPDGQALSLATTVGSTSNGKQLTVIFDTGFSLPQVPGYVANAVYGRIPGAQLVNRTDLGQIWQLPCDKEVNMTFIFGGKQIPIHPLDTNLDLNVTDNNGNHVCLGAFQPISTNTGGLFDAILGMAFIRNAYMLINYGDFIDGSTSQASPFVQLLATTNNTAEAHMDFVNVRMNGLDSTNWSLLPPSSSGSPPTTLTTQSNFVRQLKTYAPIIGGIAGALILGLIIWTCCKSRSRSRKPSARPAFMSSSRAYHPLQDPAPQGAVDLHLMHEREQYSVPPPYSEAQRKSTDFTGKNPWDPEY